MLADFWQEKCHTPNSYIELIALGKQNGGHTKPEVIIVSVYCDCHLGLHSICKHFQQLGSQYHSRRTQEDTLIYSRTDNVILWWYGVAEKPDSLKAHWRESFPEYRISVRVSRISRVNYGFVNRQKWDPAFPTNFVKTMLADFWIAYTYCCAF